MKKKKKKEHKEAAQPNSESSLNSKCTLSSCMMSCFSFIIGILSAAHIQNVRQIIVKRNFCALLVACYYCSLARLCVFIHTFCVISFFVALHFLIYIFGCCALLLHLFMSARHAWVRYTFSIFDPIHIRTSHGFECRTFIFRFVFIDCFGPANYHFHGLANS